MAGSHGTTQTILGIDPGYDRFGWAIGQATKPKVTIVACGCIQTQATDTFQQRLAQIMAGLTTIIERYHPSAVAMESLFVGRNQKTAIPVAQARGAALGQLLIHQIPIFEYTPSQIKLAVTGYGAADKAAVSKLVRLQVVGKLPDRLVDDTIDAIALLITQSACIV